MRDWLIFEDDVYTSAELSQKIETAVSQNDIDAEVINRLNIPHYGAVASLPSQPKSRPELSELFQHLTQVNRLYTQFDTEPNLSDSPATKIPVAGSLWQKIRGGAHQLVLFYVNRYGSQQNELNSHLISVLNHLVQENIDLRERIDHLEGRLAQKD